MRSTSYPLVMTSIGFEVIAENSFFVEGLVTIIWSAKFKTLCSNSLCFWSDFSDNLSCLWYTILVHGSRKSAIHFIFNFSFNPSPIRCKLCGGPVVIMVSIWFSRMYFSRYETEGLTHETLASGIKKFPLI